MLPPRERQLIASLTGLLIRLSISTNVSIASFARFPLHHIRHTRA